MVKLHWLHAFNLQHYIKLSRSFASDRLSSVLLFIQSLVSIFIFHSPVCPTHSHTRLYCFHWSSTLQSSELSEPASHSVINLGLYVPVSYFCSLTDHLLSVMFLSQYVSWASSTLLRVFLRPGFSLCLKKKKALVNTSSVWINLSAQKILDVRSTPNQQTAAWPQPTFWHLCSMLKR